MVRQFPVSCLHMQQLALALSRANDKQIETTLPLFYNLYADPYVGIPLVTTRHKP